MAELSDGCRLPPGVQLIGLQLWLPVFFTIAFCFCYVLAFHSPTPTNVPVAIVGTGQQTTAFAEQLQKGSDGALLVSTRATVAEAKADVRSSKLTAAYVPGAGKAELIIASSAQYQLATVAKTVFEPVAVAQKATLTIDDIAALPKSDSFGTSLFYQTLVWSIGGYMTGMFIGMFGASLTRRVRIGILAGASVVLPLISVIITHTIIGAVGGNFFVVWGIGAATAFAVGLVVNGLAYFLNRFVTGAALLLFVFLNIPAAGGAYPPEFVPQPFKFLHDYVSGTGTITLLRREIYGVGPSWGHGFLILGCYAAAGLLLAAVGKPWLAGHQRRRAARGALPPMMASAQAAAVALAGRSRTQPIEVVGETPEHREHREERERLEREEEREEAAEVAAAGPETGAIAAVTGEA